MATILNLQGASEEDPQREEFQLETCHRGLHHPENQLQCPHNELNLW